MKKVAHNLKSRFKTRVKNLTGNDLGSPTPPTTPPTAEATSATPESDSSTPPTSTPANVTGSPGSSSRAWTRLKNLLRSLNQVAVAELGPVKTVIDGIFQCINTYEDAARGRAEYDELRIELEGIFDELQQYFSKSPSPSITASISNICGLIQKELDYVKAQQAKSSARRLAEAESNSDNILACYRRMQGHLERLSRNTNVSTWIILDQLATDHRLKELTPPLWACYNSEKALELKRGPCTKDTRVRVLEDIREWVVGLDTGTIYWVSGMAGTGKTTIAYTLCEQLDTDTNQTLGASFFCSRSLPECRNVGRIIPSIAYQLSQYSQPFRYALSQAMERDPNAHTRLPQLQFETLIVQPFMDSKVKAAFPTTAVVIDALDECEDSKSARQMLEVLLAKSQDLPIKFIVSSRPEPAIRDQIAKNEGMVGSRMVLHELDSAEVQADIKTYLKEGLAPLNLSELEIQKLAERAGVLFIYAATVIRYIGHDNFGRNPRARLKAVLCTSKRGNAQHKEIDELYAVILGAALNDPLLDEEEREDMKLIINTVICAQEPLTVGALSGLLKLEDVDRVNAALRPLWSVLRVMGPTMIVATLHASFPDYLFDYTRSGEWHCDAASHDYVLALRCFDCIRDATPQFNICGLESSYSLDAEVEDLEKRVEESISLELYYACRYWVTHLTTSGQAVDLVQRLEQYLAGHFLLWMEVMNLKKNLSFGPTILASAKQWAIKQRVARELIDLIHDAWRFASTYVSHPVSQSTPHIYISLLSFLPSYSPIRKYYKSLAQGTIGVEGTALDRQKQSLLAKWSTGWTIYSIALSPDGTKIAVGGLSDIHILDAFSGRLFLSLSHGYIGYIVSVAFSPDGEHVVSGYTNQVLRLWNVRTGRLEYDPLAGHTDSVGCALFSHSGSRVISGSDDKTIRVWDTKSGESLLVPFIGHSDAVRSIAITSDDMRIISGSLDNTIRVWDAQSGDLILGPLEKHTQRITSISLSPDDRFIVSGSYDHTVCIWDSSTGQLPFGPFKLEGQASSVRSVSFSPDGNFVACGSDDQNVYFWDGSTGEILPLPPREHPDSVIMTVFSPDGTRFISGSFDGTICIWDAQIVATIKSPLGHSGTIWAIDISPDNTRIVSGSNDKTICVWDIQGKLLLGPLMGHTDIVRSIHFSPDGGRIVSCSHDGTIRQWDAHTGSGILDPIEGHKYYVLSVAYSPDGAHIVSGSYDEGIHVWSSSSGHMTLGPLVGHKNSPTVKFFPDGTKIVAGSGDGSVCVWDAQNGEVVLGPLHGHSSSVKSVEISHDGSRIASCSQDNFYLWDARTGERINLTSSEPRHSTLAFQLWEDGTAVISATQNNYIYLSDARTGEAITRPLIGHTEFVTCVALASDNTHVVSASSDTIIRVWEARPQQPDLTGLNDWILDKDGWVLDGQSRRLSWAPPSLHPFLIRPKNTALCSQYGFVRLQFKGYRGGEAWAETYRPKTLLDNSA